MARVRRSGRRGRRFESAISDHRKLTIAKVQLDIVASIVQWIERRFPKP